jgi:hypothetical protein
MEAALRTPVGEELERWERTRKIRRFQRLNKDRPSASFDVDRCKGHFDSNEQLILKAFEARLRRL